MENKKNQGFLKGLAVGILLSVISIAVLAGCSKLGTLIGPGSDYNSTKKTEEQTEEKTEKETNEKSTSSSKKPASSASAFTAKSPQLTTEVLQKIDTIMQIIDYYYLYDYDQEEMINSIYRAVIESLDDPYSTYYTAEEFESFLESASGTYCGIGVVVQQNVETGIVTAVKPYLNAPGYEAGIRPGDYIIAVDGTEITGMDLSAAVAMIRGEEGTSVTITLEREGKQFDVVVTRRQIHVETVTYKMLEDKIGYIAVEEFDEVTLEQFRSAMDDLEAQGMKGLVIDLRNNPGGLLDTVVQMLDDILPKGLIVSVKDKYGKTEEHKSDAKTRLNVPLAVLINENSASASEIFAGAVQDYGVGTLVGKTTFGKGIVQTTLSFGDGTGMKVTVEDYYIPSGRSIHKVGVSPDVEVDLPDELKVLVTIPEDEDTQLMKAIEILTNGR